VGLGDWPPRTLYVVKGPDVYEFSPDLTTAWVFVSFPGKPSSHSGITFDRSGVWNFDMIVTFTDGTVYRVDPDGNTTLVADVGLHHESPRVLPDEPLLWGAYAGCITTSAEKSGEVFAICPDGGISVLASGIPGAESSDVRPLAGEVTFGDTPYVYFASRFAFGEVWAYPASSFPPDSAGHMFVSQEFAGGIVEIAGPGQVSVFEEPFGQHYEGSNFCFHLGIVDMAEICGNGFDEDGDGLVDYMDPDCPCPVDGDVDASETLSIVDVQCTLLMALWELGGGVGDPPECVVGDLLAADMNCDQTTTIQDVMLAVAFVLGAPFDPAIDANGNACPDSCELPPEVLAQP